MYHLVFLGVVLLKRKHKAAYKMRRDILSFIDYNYIDLIDICDQI